MRVKQTKKRYILGTILFAAASIAPFFQAASTYADQITTRSLTLQSASGVGGSTPGGVVNHLFGFTLASVGDQDVGSIRFDYCTTAAGTCTTPTGLDTTSASMGTQTGATGFTLNNTTNGSPYITRTAATVTADTAVTYQLLSITNPTDVNTTFFVRITSYTGTDGATGAVDTGTVAASTANQIDFTGFMPETLVFCTGVTVDATCTTVTNATINLGVFSPSSTTTATSEMAASTNADNGYVITVDGATLTSGSNTIPAIGGTAAASSIGSSQFGLNLVTNTTPAVGADMTPAFDGGDYQGSVSAPFDTADDFAFDDTTTQEVASSTGPSAAQKYTVSYIVNVAGNQSPGNYTTTLTYICTPTY